MVDIDRLRRISLRDLKPYFTHLNRIRGQVADLLDKKPERQAEVLAVVEDYLQGSLSFSGSDSVTYTIQAKVNEEVEIESFLFRWEYDGEPREQRVWLTSRPSNLDGAASCYYFVCPYADRICRKLYTDGRTLASRYSFPHTYSDRNSSHQWRETKKALRLTLFLDKEENLNRRESYGGRLTRFGRRLRDIAGGDTFEEIQMKQTSLIASLFAPPSRRGRPPRRRAENPERGGSLWLP